MVQQFSNHVLNVLLTMFIHDVLCLCCGYSQDKMYVNVFSRVYSQYNMLIYIYLVNLNKHFE